MPQPAYQNYHIEPALAGLALGPVLRQLLPGTSWSQVRRLVENRHVEINGNLATDIGRRLKAGDVIRVWQEPRSTPAREEDIKILYSDRHLVVVEKPAGVTCTRHSEERDWPARRRQVQPTLDEMLGRILARRAKSPSRRDQPRGKQPAAARVKAVHRLDRDTSGVMLFARSPAAEQRLVQMFRKHELERTYLAIVVGDVSARRLESQLVRDRGDGRRGSTTLPNVGKRAVTHVRPIEGLGDYTLVECRLETGRTHQIRIQLAEAGHIVCGEKVYNKPFRGKPQEDRSGAARQALHAARLAFNHPITGERLEFEMPLPADMQRLLKKLRVS